MTRFQGIETIAVTSNSILPHLLQKWPDSRGLKPPATRLLAGALDYRNDPIPGDWNYIILHFTKIQLITEMTRFQGIETLTVPPLIKESFITEMTRFQGIETQQGSV